MIDQDPATIATDLKAFDALAMNDKDAATVSALYEAYKYQSRTFLDKDQNPTLSLTIDKEGNVSGVSKFKVDTATENILWVDYQEMIDQDPATIATDLKAFDALAMNDKDAATVSALYEADKYQSRTFLDKDQNPTLSLTIDKEGSASGDSKFKVDTAT